MHNHLQEISDFVSAAIPVIWVQTHEDSRMLDLMAGFRNERGFSVMSYDVVNQLKAVHTTPGQQIAAADMAQISDPVGAVQFFTEQGKVEAPSGKNPAAILVILDAHKLVGNIAFIRAIKDFIASKAFLKHVFLVSHTNMIPEELEKEVMLAHMSLPSTADLERLAVQLKNENGLGALSWDGDIIKAVSGLTELEATSAYSLSLVKNERQFVRTDLEKFKLEAVKKSGMMEIFPAVDEGELGGLEKLKKYMHSRAAGFNDPSLPTPTGILLMGLPGGGKSLSAKVIASILKMPLIKLDIASLKSKYVGESESKMGQALNLIDAISPAVVWLDEIEKSVGGVLSSNHSDGGTSSAMFGKLLTWMQESKKPKFIVATCNDIQPLLEVSHGALIRRFDDVFFVDTPSDSEKKEILKIHNKKYAAQVPEEAVSSMHNWTGAEIEKLCKSSRFEGFEQAMANIRPIYHQNKNLFEKMRDWANKNARPANESVGVEDTVTAIQKSWRKLAI